jgi:hypothetical protein
MGAIKKTNLAGWPAGNELSWYWVSDGGTPDPAGIMTDKNRRLEQILQQLATTPFYVTGGTPKAIHDQDDKEEVSGYAVAKIEMENFEKIADTALRALESASETRTQKAFLLGFGTGAKMAFVASIGTNGIPSIPTGDAVTLKCTLSLAGRVSKWST